MKNCQECDILYSPLIQGRCKTCYNRYHYSDKFVQKYPDLPASLTSFQQEVLNGLMLGDGSLRIGRGKVNPSLYVGRSIKDEEYLLWNHECFKDFCPALPKRYKGSTFSKDNSYIYLNSRCAPAFRPTYDKWYPDDTKIVPPDLILTPLTIAVWLCDDGTVYSDQNRVYRLYTHFYTCGFSKDDNMFLISLLEAKYGDGFSLGKDNSRDPPYLHIKSNDTSTRRMLNDIDSVFPLSMDRKAIWRQPESRFYENQPEEVRSIIRLKKERRNSVISLIQEMKITTVPEIASRIHTNETDGAKRQFV